MMNDSVREELLSKVSISKPLKIEKTEMKENYPASVKLKLPATVKEETNSSNPAAVARQKPVAAKSDTENIASKSTSPTLVEFHSKNSAVPEWRVHLQNAVRQRHERGNQELPNAAATVAAVAAAPRKTKLATRGANALKAEAVEEKRHARVKNPTLSSALERIEKSRQKFLVEEVEELSIAPVVAPPRPANKNFPFYIASKKVETTPPNVAEPNEPTNLTGKPKLAVTVSRTESGDLDTNKLPPLAEKISKIFNKAPENLPKVEGRGKNETKPVENEELALTEGAENQEEFEDFAPVALRFNAGFFDLIIGTFLSLFLLSPFMLTGGDWFTFTGLLAFLATCSIVMFTYLTTTIGFYGRTFGMRIFSLEVIDIEGENYPTLHQAAVSSAVYLLSLALGGIGFLTLPFNEERRAVHDLVSGTIVVKES